MRFVLHPADGQFGSIRESVDSISLKLAVEKLPLILLLFLGWEKGSILATDIAIDKFALIEISIIFGKLPHSRYSIFFCILVIIDFSWIYVSVGIMNGGIEDIEIEFLNLI